MKKNALVPYVETILDNEIRVVCRDAVASSKVRSLGGRRVILMPGVWALKYSSEDDLAHDLSALRDAGVAMGSAPAGWPPAAVFEDLRQKGKITGKYMEIVWAKKSQEVLSEK